MKNNKEIILSNLKEMHKGKKVNTWCAVKGIENSTEAFIALDELVHDGLVRKTKLRIDKNKSAPLYQYNFLEM